jgi:hypothetical protein
VDEGSVRIYIYIYIYTRKWLKERKILSSRIETVTYLISRSVPDQKSYIGSVFTSPADFVAIGDATSDAETCHSLGCTAACSKAPERPYGKYWIAGGTPINGADKASWNSDPRRMRHDKDSIFFS